MLTIPEGYAIEAKPRDVTLKEDFGTFTFHMEEDGRQIRVTNSLRMHAGSFPASLYPQFVAFRRSIANLYAQKIVLKKR